MSFVVLMPEIIEEKLLIFLDWPHNNNEFWCLDFECLKLCKKSCWYSQISHTKDKSNHVCIQKINNRVKKENALWKWYLYQKVVPWYTLIREILGDMTMNMNLHLAEFETQLLFFFYVHFFFFAIYILVNIRISWRI